VMKMMLGLVAWLGALGSVVFSMGIFLSGFG